MRTTVRVLLLGILFASVAYGQNPVISGVAPVLEAGIGYSYVDASVPSEGKLGMNGVQAILNADLQRRFGFKLDVGYARSFDAFGSRRSADLLTYMAGPVFYPVRKRNLNVYTHLLLGGARETGVNFESNDQMVLGFVNKFAWAGGAGFQYRLTQSFSMRVGADYLRTAYFNTNIAVQGQSNIRSSISLVYTFGENRE